MIVLNGMQKSALLLVSMDLKASVQVLKYFTKLEIKNILDAVISLDKDAFQYSDDLIHEFYYVLKKNEIFDFDTNTRILKILEEAIGEGKSNKLFKSSLIKNSFFQNISMLEALSLKDIFILIRDENFSIVAALLMFFKKNVSAQILSLFNKQLRLNILTIMTNFSGLEDIGFYELNRIVYRLLCQYHALAEEERKINRIAEILSILGFKNIIQFIKKINVSYLNIRNKVVSKYFQFDNIIELRNKDINFIIKNINIKQLYSLLNVICASIKNKFISNMSSLEYKNFQKYIGRHHSISFEEIYLQKNLLLTKIKRFIQDGIIFLK